MSLTKNGASLHLPPGYRKGEASLIEVPSPLFSCCFQCRDHRTQERPYVFLLLVSSQTKSRLIPLVWQSHCQRSIRPKIQAQPPERMIPLPSDRIFSKRQKK